MRKSRERRQLCRFSAAGNDSLTTRYGDRRLKSAKARSRGKLGTDWQRALWGFQVGAEVTAGNGSMPRAACLQVRDVRSIRWVV
jgi:hypothetical protein